MRRRSPPTLALMSVSEAPRLLLISTLHKFHADVPAYGYSTLRDLLEQLAPDDLFLEVSDADLTARPNEGMKCEYPEAVYPFLDGASTVRAHALEPSGPLRDAILEKYVTGNEKFRRSPEYAPFESYVHTWAQSLLERFRTAADFNSAEIDEMVRLKHDYQASLYPREYTDAWEAWNEHFYDRIVDVVGKWKPRLAVALVGLEHAYWLRPRLAARPDMRLLDPHQLLGRL